MSIYENNLEAVKWLKKVSAGLSSFAGRKAHREAIEEKREMFLEWDKKQNLGLFTEADFNTDEMASRYYRATAPKPEDCTKEKLQGLFD